MAVHILPKLLEVRFFEPGKSYEAADDHYAAMNITLFGGLAEASMATARAEMTREDMRDLCIQLFQAGAVVFKMYRAKGRCIPFGRKVWEGKEDDLWEVNLQKLPFVHPLSISVLRADPKLDPSQKPMIPERTPVTTADTTMARTSSENPPRNTTAYTTPYTSGISSRVT